MNNLKVAREIMTPNPIFIQSGAELRDTIEFFTKNFIHSAPVVTPVDEILGMMTEISVLKASLRQFLDSEKHEKVIHHADILEPVTAVEDDTPVQEVLKVMIKAPSHRVLVLSKQKKLIGIISPKDIIRYVIGEKDKGTNLKQEVEKQKIELERLMKENSQLKAALDVYQTVYMDTPLMMHSVDENGKIVMANRKIHQVLGYDENELLGKSIYDIYPAHAHDKAREGLKKIKQEGYDRVVYSSLICKNGEKKLVDIASGALKNHEGQFVCTITVSREIDSDSLLRALHGLEDFQNVLK